MLTQIEHKHTGRFANRFFQNIAVHFVAKKYDILANYLSEEQFNKLGIELYKGGKLQSHVATKEMNESTFMDIITSDIECCTIIYANGYYQTKEFALYIKNNLDWNTFLNRNVYKERYNTNNDVFCHVRLGDVEGFNPGFAYYDSVLSKLSFENAYISSDSPKHNIVTSLKNKYNMTQYDRDEVDTLLFGSTCKYIILSKGTYSWLLGMLGKYSSVFFPEEKKMWHGDIFVFPEWTKVALP